MEQDLRLHFQLFFKPTTGRSDSVMIYGNFALKMIPWNAEWPLGRYVPLVLINEKDLFEGCKDIRKTNCYIFSQDVFTELTE